MEANGGSPATVALLAEDPELGVGLQPEELQLARRLLHVPVIAAGVGPWDLEAALGEPANLGLLILDGLISVNVVLGDRVATQLAGPGDVVHVPGTPEALVPAVTRHFISERARLAVLDRHFIAAVRRWPAILLALHERLRVQESRLEVHAAIGKLRRVDDRLLALLWQLAERWGRVTPGGVMVPLALTHETLGRLVGAERPTVSLALKDLAASGDIRRRAAGGFVLRQGSQARLLPTDEARPQVRPLAVARTPDAPALSELPRPSLDAEALRQRVAVLREQMTDLHLEMGELLAASRGAEERRQAAHARPRGEGEDAAAEP